MDDPYTPENQTPSPDINPPASSAPPAAPPPPAEPESIAPPAPGQVVTGDSGVPTGGSMQSSAYGAGPAGGAPPKAVVFHNGGGKRWLKTLIIIIVLVLLGAGGWFVYTKYIKKTPFTPTVHSKNVPILKIGVGQATYGELYPNMNDTDYAYLVNAQMFEGLVRYEDKSKIVPDLASTWTNPDSTTWIFTIKSGIKFHDGHTLTASDVKYSLNTVLATNSQLAQDFGSTIASVDTVGTNQVKITTNVPDPALLNKLNFLYIIDANLPKGDEPSQAGTGPYEIKPGTKPTNTHIQMVAYDGYHGGSPTTRALDFGSASGPAALVKAFKAHQYNIVGPMSEVDAKTAPSAKRFTANEPDVEFIAFNTVQPGPLQNKLVREAIRYAVSPLSISKADDQEGNPQSQLIPQQIPGFNPAVPAYKQDIAKAKQLLAQAGYPNGLTIRFSSSDSSGKYTEITNELKQVGITLTADPQNSNFQNDFPSFVDYFSAGKAEMYDVDYSSDTLDGLDIYTTTLPNANYNNPQLNDLLTQANTTIDPAKRLKLLQEAATIIDQDIPVVPLYSENNIWLMDKPYVIQQDMPSSLISVYFYKVQQ